MTSREFKELLETARPQAVRMLVKRKVQQWMEEDGQAGVAEAVACMIDHRLDLGEDSVLVAMAQAVGLVEG